jgi:hypothetical protein
MVSQSSLAIVGCEEAVVTGFCVQRLERFCSPPSCRPVGEQTGDKWYCATAEVTCDSLGICAGKQSRLRLCFAADNLLANLAWTAKVSTEFAVVTISSRNGSLVSVLRH